MAGQLSNKGFQFLVKHEGFVSKPYSDGKYYSVGYGHNGPEVDPNRTYTKAEAEAFFAKDKIRFENDVNKIWHEPMTQNMFDALFSLAYNTGNVSKSTIAQLVEGNGWQNTEKIKQWWQKFKCTQKGKTLSGLVNRRNNEVTLFFTADEGDSGGPFTGNTSNVPADLWTPKNSGILGAAPATTNTVGSMYRSLGEPNNYENRSSVFAGADMNTTDYASNVFKKNENEDEKHTRIYQTGEVKVLVDEFSMPLEDGYIKNSSTLNSENETV